MEKLREYIKKQGMTQKKFAQEVLQVHPQWLNNLLTGRIPPTIRSARRIYMATNGDITIDMIMPEITELLK
jgi:transcriptional regulator with XRE-family HTH domain